MCSSPSTTTTPTFCGTPCTSRSSLRGDIEDIVAFGTPVDIDYVGRKLIGFRGPTFHPRVARLRQIVERGEQSRRATAGAPFKMHELLEEESTSPRHQSVLAAPPVVTAPSPGARA